MMRTFQGKNGRKVQSPYTDEEALGRLRALVKARVLVGDFPEKLAALTNPSAGQNTWIHILVVEAENSEDVGARYGVEVRMPNLNKVRDLFARADFAGLRAPRVRMETEDAGRVVVKVAGPRSKFAGSLIVTDGGGFGEQTYYGRVGIERVDGVDVFHAGRSCTAGVVRALIDLALDPAGCASAFGKITGSCCFCGLDLTDGRSISVGYGPICADKFGLPWGDSKVETTVELDTKDNDQVGWS